MAKIVSVTNERATLPGRLPPLGTPIEWAGSERYEVVGRLGQGGMGIVYEALDRSRDEVVAVKVLPAECDADSLYRFKGEFRALADIHHANLVRYYELTLPETGRAYFSMELVRGVDLSEYVSAGPRGRTRAIASAVALRAGTDRAQRDTLRPGRPSAEGEDSLQGSPADLGKLRMVLRQLVEAIQALHAAGVLHRDIKPSNVLVTPQGRVVLLDLGVATSLRRRAEQGSGAQDELVGTPAYMAPEQACGETPGPASDWYSVGVMLYEALVGHVPFKGTLTDVLTMKTAMDPPPPSLHAEGVPADLDALCLALLDRDPSRRPSGPEIVRRLVSARSGSAELLGAREMPAEFVGREGPLSILREALDQTRATGRPVVVRVAGAPGLGKSTLVHRFLDDLAERGHATVLRGRTYERESVPYKALDGVVDALCSRWIHLTEAGDAPPLPANAAVLGRLFPVWLRIPGLDPGGRRNESDPEALRGLAVVALKEILASLAARGPLVLFLDDVHWGDTDSATLLCDLLRPPDAPPLLLVMTYREQQVKTSPFSIEMRERWPESTAVHDVVVGPLALEDRRRLALALLGANDPTAQRTAQAIARESYGSPFLVEELVRSNRGEAPAGGGTLSILTLEAMVGERLARLPDDARRFVEVMAVGARPLPLAVVAKASGIAGSTHELVGTICSESFARTGLREGREIVETTHDRIRETVVAQLSEAALRGLHRDLAGALEGHPGAGSEAIALHWIGAGDPGRAARFASDAAEQALATLAFAEAARLFRLALDCGGGSLAGDQRLRERLAECLQFSGRHAEAAEAYLAATADAPQDRRSALQCAAADQMLMSGRVVEGGEMLRGVLRGFGIAAPRSPLGALLLLVVYRVWLALLGLRFRERAPGEVLQEDRTCIDALYAAAMGLAAVDVIAAACLQARHLIEALRKGDRFQVLRAVAIEAAQSAAMGKQETERERDLVAIARDLAEREATEDAHAFFEAVWGVGLFQRGRWKEARALFEMRIDKLSYSRFSLANPLLFNIHSHYFLGHWKDNAARIDRVLADADQRRDLFLSTSLRTATYLFTPLRADKPDEARRTLRDAIARWPQTGFFVQHFTAMVYEANIDLYLGEGGRAYERFVKSLPALRRSLLLHSGFVRGWTWYTHARAAIASIASDPSRKAKRIAEARRMARLLEREYDPWMAVLASLASAMAENAAGSRPAAISALRSAIARAEATHTITYLATARHRLGELLGDGEGAELVRAALDALALQEVRSPDRWLAMDLPGSWSQGPGRVASVHLPTAQARVSREHP